MELFKSGLTFASGLASITSVTYLLKAGDHILCGDDVYGGTGRLFRQCSSRMGIEVSFFDSSKAETVLEHLKPTTRLVWLETPTNPTLKLCDIRSIVKQVKSTGRDDIVVAVDNTFMSPYFQKPLDLGADLVMHSITKYLNGHSDVIMGCLITNNEELYKQLLYYQNGTLFSL
jgi:cystathionine gamma-lyase